LTITIAGERAMCLLKSVILVYMLFVLTGCKTIYPPQTATSIKDDFQSLVKFSPDEFTGWNLSSPVRAYDRNTLFDYIDGAAELYFAYNFSRAVTAEYRDGDVSLIVDVYDMSTPESAYGIYSLNRSQDANYVAIGNEGILTEASLDFWKCQYYCKVYCFGSSEKYKNAVVNIGTKLAERIEKSGSEPDLIKKLPQNGLIPKTAKYFSRKLGLDSIHYISDENILGLDGETKGAVAEYQLDDEKLMIFVIEYPSAEKADSAFIAYTKYLGEKSEHIRDNDIFNIDGKYVSIMLKDQTISGIWDSKNIEHVKSALQRLE